MRGVEPNFEAFARSPVFKSYSLGTRSENLANPCSGPGCVTSQFPPWAEQWVGETITQKKQMTWGFTYELGSRNGLFVDPVSARFQGSCLYLPGMNRSIAKWNCPGKVETERPTVEAASAEEGLPVLVHDGKPIERLLPVHRPRPAPGDVLQSQILAFINLCRSLYADWSAIA